MKPPPTFREQAHSILYAADEAATGVGDSPVIKCWVTALCDAHERRDLAAMRAALEGIQAAALAAKDRRLTTAERKAIQLEGCPL